MTTTEQPPESEAGDVSESASSEEMSPEARVVLPWLWPAAVLIVISTTGWLLGERGSIWAIATVVLLVAVVVGRLLGAHPQAGLTWGVVLAAALAILLPEISAIQNGSANLIPAGADVSVVGADLSGSDLRGADLTGVSMRGADLSNSCLSGAILVEADLAGADLTGADLRGATFDDGAPDQAAVWPSESDQLLSTACD